MNDREVAAVSPHREDYHLHIPARTTLASTALAIAISMISFSGAAAQVASLQTPDPEAEASPAAVDIELEDETDLPALEFVLQQLDAPGPRLRQDSQPPALCRSP